MIFIPPRNRCICTEDTSSSRSGGPANAGGGLGIERPHSRASRPCSKRRVSRVGLDRWWSTVVALPQYRKPCHDIIQAKFHSRSTWSHCRFGTTQKLSVWAIYRYTTRGQQWSLLNISHAMVSSRWLQPAQISPRRATSCQESTKGVSRSGRPASISWNT